MRTPAVPRRRVTAGVRISAHYLCNAAITIIHYHCHDGRVSRQRLHIRHVWTLIAAIVFTGMRTKRRAGVAVATQRKVSAK